jgi:hypothetical protein
MSSQNGDKARFNRLRKQKLRLRERMARLATQLAASGARLGETRLQSWRSGSSRIRAFTNTFEGQRLV